MYRLLSDILSIEFFLIINMKIRKKRLYFEGIRDTIFFGIIRIIKAKKLRILLSEIELILIIIKIPITLK
jgi:hypothetical protein